MRLRRLALLLAISTGIACATQAPPAADDDAPYVFAWPFLDQPMQPRGGTSRGADVTLAAAPSEAWQRLRAPDLSPRERDRAAILAMAGDYRTSFDFLETVLFAPGALPAQPYRSWGTERIYVVASEDDFVSLQHILVMFVVDEQGETQGPFVQKHWRQDWRYEPERVVTFLGGRDFAARRVPEEKRRGAWSQTVYQVDDSPRYGSLGRWVHHEGGSIWEGSLAWRPLPRRESSVRDDYAVLVGHNRHTVLPLGWVHEQDNQKLADRDGHPIAVEVGVNRYERMEGFDFSAGDAYWEATAPFWEEVRNGWARRFASDRTLTVAKRCDDEPAFVPFFRAAAKLEAGEAFPPEAQRAEAERLLDCVAATGPAH